MQSFFCKYVLCFIISALFLSFVPVKTFVSAESQSYLSTLPFDKPIGHNKGYADFEGQKVIVVFGRITCGNTMYYVPYINSLIEQASLEDDLKVLFYDVDQAMSEVTSYVEDKAWKNIHSFSGGTREMWQGLHSQGIANNVTFPAVFYLDEQGSITHHSINFQNEKEIKSNVAKTLNRPDSDLNEVIQISVLADSEKMSYESRKAEITKRLDLIDQDLIASNKSEPNAKSPIERANEQFLVPEELNQDFGKVITRAEFSKLAVMLYEKLNGTIIPTVTFTDTENIYVRKAATIGIVSGVGNGKFNPLGELNRQQAAKIVDLLAQALGLTPQYEALTYADNNKISEWAKPFVASVGANKLMTGEANNLFNPKGKYTRKQSIVTLMRVYDTVKK